MAGWCIHGILHRRGLQVACAGWPYAQIEDMPFAQCKLVYRWAAHVYKNHSLMQRADEMPAHDVGAGGALYYTFGLTVDDWVSLVYPSAAASRLGGLKTDDAIADGGPLRLPV